MTCLHIYREELSLTTFIRVCKRYPAAPDKINILKTICRIKPKFFLLTKHQENLLLGKYLISVDAALKICYNGYRKEKIFIVRRSRRDSIFISY